MVLIVHARNRLADDFFSLHEFVIRTVHHALFFLGCHNNNLDLNVIYYLELSVIVLLQAAGVVLIFAVLDGTHPELLLEGFGEM